MRRGSLYRSLSSQIHLHQCGMARCIALPSPEADIWTEMINADVTLMTLNVTSDGSPVTVSVPSWYGYVFLL